MADIGLPGGNPAGCRQVQATPRDRCVAFCAWVLGRLSRCSVVSPSSTAERPRCGSSTPSGISSAETGTRIETVALYTDADRTATFVREADLGLRPRPRLGPPLPRPRRARTRAGRDRRRRGVGRLGLRRRGPGVRRAVREDRRHVRRPERRRDAQARRQDRREADRRGGRRAGRAVEPRGRSRTLDAALAAGGRDRLPADAQGHRGRRRARHPRGHLRRGARRRLRAHQPGGRARVRQRRGVPGAPGHRRPARRGPGDRRRPGHRVGARRARLLGAAAQPEDHRGVGLAGARRRSRPPS